jgi:imidazolonepropionase
MLRLGTTAVEIKSGYGLNTETELKLLRAARAAAGATPLAFTTTFLGAHTLPAEARDSASARERHVTLIVEEMIPLVVAEGLAEFADVFIDEHAFTLDEARRVLEAAKARGLRPKVHTGQLARDGGMLLAAELGATSADHLEYASDEDLEALAKASVVGVLLPGATLFLRMEQWAPGQRMVAAGVPVAVATDVNPGSCPSESMPLMMQLACLRCGLSIDEAIVAATLNAAAACGLEKDCGSIEPGKRCDLLVIDAETRAEIVYALGSPRTHMVVAEGRVVA